MIEEVGSVGHIIPASKTELIVDDKTEDEIVEEIVVNWNRMVTKVQNATIDLSLMVKKLTKDRPDETIKDIFKKVREHPNIKMFVSLDRIWQGLRLINKRPELIEYHNLDEDQKNNLPEDRKPYLKKDGEVFWEFYFELAKQNLNEGILVQIEQEGKREGWSFRTLRSKLQEIKDEITNPGAYVSERAEKSELIGKIMVSVRKLPVEELRGVYKYIRNK